MKNFTRRSSLNVTALFCVFSFLLTTVTWASDSVLILVDGIGPATIGPPDLLRGPNEDRFVNYLESSVVARTLKNAIGGDVISIRWNGDVFDKTNIAKAEADTSLAILKAAKKGSSVSILTHSYGTVIAYQALSNLADKTHSGSGYFYRGVTNFVTLASPLWTKGDLKSPAALLIKHRWINASAANDPIGGYINVSQVINLPPIANVLDPIRAHRLPYRDEATAQKIAEFVMQTITNTAVAESTTPGTKAYPQTKTVEPHIRSAQSRSATQTQPKARTSEPATAALGDTKGWDRVRGIEALKDSLPSDLSVETIKDLLNDTSGSPRAAGIKLLAPHLISALDGSQAAQIVDDIEEWDRVRALKAIIGKLKADMPPEDMLSALQGTSGEARVEALRVVSGRLRVNITGAEASAVLGETVEWDRVRGIKEIAPKLKKNFSAEEITETLQGISGSARSEAVRLLMQSSTQ